jgi:hypothetical protein
MVLDGSPHEIAWTIAYVSLGSLTDPTPDATVPNGSPQKLNARHRRKVRATDSNSELDQFFIFCKFDNNCGDDPLEWWHAKCRSFPNLYRMVRDIFAISGKISKYMLNSCYSIFHVRICCSSRSGGRDTIGIRRASLNAETIRTLMVVKARLRMARTAIIELLGDD